MEIVFDPKAIDDWETTDPVLKNALANFYEYFDIKIPPNMPVKPPAVWHCIITPKNPGLFDKVPSDGWFFDFTVSAFYGGISITSEIMTIEMRNPSSPPRPEGSVVYRDPIPIYLASDSIFQETVGDSFSIAGQIRFQGNPGQFDVKFRKIKLKWIDPRGFNEEKVIDVNANGQFRHTIENLQRDQLMWDLTDRPLEIHAEFDTEVLAHLPLKGRSETLYLPIGALSSAAMPAAKRIFAFTNTEGIPFDTLGGEILFVSGKPDPVTTSSSPGALTNALTENKMKRLVSSIQKNLQIERRMQTLRLKPQDGTLTSYAELKKSHRGCKGSRFTDSLSGRALR